MNQQHRKQFAAAIRDLRISLGMTVAHFGKAIGVTRLTVYRYESGELNPSLETIARVALFCSRSQPDTSRQFWEAFCAALGTSLTDLTNSMGRAA